MMEGLPVCQFVDVKPGVVGCANCPRQFQSSVTAAKFRGSCQPTSDGRLTAQEPVRKLTRAERDVALMLLKGEGHKQAAARLGRSERTVRQHAVEVYRKSGLQGRAELAAFFLQDLGHSGAPLDTP